MNVKELNQYDTYTSARIHAEATNHDKDADAQRLEIHRIVVQALRVRGLYKTATTWEIASQRKSERR